MNFDIPEKLQNYLKELDEFIEREIKPIENSDDNIRFFDHRREDARTDWDKGGLPSEDWEALLHRVKRIADKAGHFRYAQPVEYGGKAGSNLDMAVIREHFASKGLGLHNDLQNEHSVVGNNVGLMLMILYGTEDRRMWYPHIFQRNAAMVGGHVERPQHLLQLEAFGIGRRQKRGDPITVTRLAAGARHDQWRQDLEHGYSQGQVRHDHGAHQRQAG